MRYLGSALYVEGVSDTAFLSILLQRLCLEVLAGTGTEIGDVIPLQAPKHFRQEKRAKQILEATREVYRSIHILFVHADGASNPENVRIEQVNPGLAQVAQELQCLGIAVIPVHEMEAWALADGEALRQAFGSNLADRDLAIPAKPRLVEHITDPKAALDQAYWAVIGKPSRYRAAMFLDSIAQRIDLKLLYQIPSFEQCAAELRAALVQMNYLK
jgi:Domain of unknown function (DUF4276)